LSSSSSSLSDAFTDSDGNLPGDNQDEDHNDSAKLEDPRQELVQPFEEELQAEESEDEGVLLARSLRQIASLEHKPSSSRRLRKLSDPAARRRSKSAEKRRSHRPRGVPPQK
jgi:hypothetical protein